MTLTGLHNAGNGKVSGEIYLHGAFNGLSKTMTFNIAYAKTGVNLSNAVGSARIAGSANIVTARIFGGAASLSSGTCYVYGIAAS